jgi:hypothetical protein
MAIIVEFYELITRVSTVITEKRSYSILYTSTSDNLLKEFLRINPNSNLVYPLFRIKQILAIINYNIQLSDNGKRVNKEDRYGAAVAFGRQYIPELKHHYNYLVRELISMNRWIFKKMPSRLKYI